MKKTFSIFFIVISFCLYADIIEQTYFFDNYKISERDGFQVINFDNTLLTGKVGEPVLPYHSVSLLLPPGEEAVSIEIIGKDETIIPGSFNLYPQQQSRPISEGRSEEFIINNSLYTSLEIYPAKLSGELITEFMNGFGFALCTFTPVRYIPSSGEITYFKEVEIKIITGSSQEAIKALNNLRTSRSVLENVSRFAQNDRNISLYPNRNSREDEYEILIITAAQFESEFQSYIDLYLMRGMLTEIVTIEYINANIPGQDTQEKIRNYIIQEYQDSAIEQVVLAGDVEHVPYRGFYCYVDSGSGYTSDDIPADLYFSALDGTWNDDGDNNWGEIGEDDLLPDVSVGRMSFSNLSELSIMLNKTISYQDTPVLGELQKPLLLGEHMYSDPQTWGGDFLDLLIGFHDDNGYTTNGIPVDHDYETMYDRDLGYWSDTELINKINEGIAFIHHAGHANTNYNMRMNTSDITNTNFSLVNGVDHNFTFVYTHGCMSGGFDSSDCIAEYMVKIDNFAAAFVGNSRYGWFNEGQTEGPSLHLHREFVDALYSDKTRWIGSAHLESKIDTSPWVTAPGQWEEGALRWCFYDCNVLGDPALSIWTDEPLELDAFFSPVIPQGYASFPVEIQNNGNPVENMQCTLMQYGELIGTAVTNASGDAMITFDPDSVTPGDAELYICGYNRPVEMHQLQIIPIGCFVTVSDHSVVSGNDNVVEFGENTFLSLILEEVGNYGDINNVVVEISSSDEFIVINDNTENVGTILSGGTVELIDAFDFDIDNNIPDEHSIELTVVITSDEGDWYSGIYLVGYNAVLEMNSVEVIDGDNNVLDPGETAELAVEIHNLGGADLYNLIPSISSSNPDIIITNLPVLLDSLNADGIENIVVCSVEVSEDAQIGDIIDFDLEIIADYEFSFSVEFALVIGLSIEDFETGDFSSYNWEFAGAADWVIDSNSYEGIYCAKSGSIGNNSYSTLKIELDVTAAGNISFWKKVSSEATYDFLRFYIDGSLLDEWSGEDDWSEEIYPVTSGTHLFEWKYVKDTYVSIGDDCGWIDYIVFPPIAGEVVTNGELIPNVTKLIGNYPNPFNPSTTISFSTAKDAENAEILIYNIKGQKVKQLLNEALPAGKHSVIWNGRDSNNHSVASGLYFAIFKAGPVYSRIKMVLIK